MNRKNTEEYIIEMTAGDLADKFPQVISALSFWAYERDHSSGKEEVLATFRDLMDAVFQAIRKDLENDNH